MSNQDVAHSSWGQSVPGSFIILDFGSQFTQLIARRLRELNFFSEILPYHTSIDEIKKRKPRGIILSGGPSSVHDEGSPTADVRALSQIAPLLGICYGMQLITHGLGGRVEAASGREYGHGYVTWSDPLSPKIPLSQKVWMSHGDVVKVPPPGFKIVAYSDAKHAAAMRGDRIWAVQFHPEVAHTDYGSELLKEFALVLCEARPNWNSHSIVEHLIRGIREKIGPNEKVLCGLSGGVDSSVVAALLTRALDPTRVYCVFVNNGLLRKNEYDEVLRQYRLIGLNVTGVDAEEQFLSELEGISEPEAKRKTIGRVFIDVFSSAAKKKGEEFQWLAQGTLYPDVIESISPRGASVIIKSHHNVGGLPEKMNMKLVEPLRELFKDEVRRIGRELDLPEEMLGRHPFPGPGLAVRCLGDVTREKLSIIREADHIFIKALKDADLYDKIWQAFCVLLPIRSVGVQGDARTYDRALALRAITSTDGMTADWYPFEFSFLREVSNRITNQVAGINRVVYDVTSKPPGTIEWE